MNILHVLNGSVPLIAGYTTRAKYIISSQLNAGLNPTVVTSTRQGPTDSSLEVIDSVKYYRTNWPNTVLSIFKDKPFISLLIEMFLLYQNIIKIIKKERIEILHAHSPIMNAIPALLASKRKKLPFIYEIRALWEDAAVDSKRTNEFSLRYWLTRIIETLIVKCADHVVVICEGLRKELIERGVKIDKISVIKNGVDTDIFVPINKNKELIKKFHFENKIVIGYIGSFYKFEGVHYIIHAAKKLYSRNIPIAVLIVGGGQEAENLRELVKKSNLGDSLIMPGMVPHKDIKSYYSIVDIFIYPRESKRITELVTPLKPLEAMAMGKIVLASNVGGLKELVNEGENGYLFEKDNVDDMADKIEWLIVNYEQIAKPEKYRESVKTNRRWSITCMGYKNIYNKLI